MLHHLKCDEPHYTAVVKGIKKFELRMFDRPFQVGDVLILEQQTVSDNGERQKTGMWTSVLVDFILENYAGLQAGYCVLSIIPCCLYNTPKPLAKENFEQVYGFNTWA